MTEPQHPHVLHATAALHALRASWPRLHALRGQDDADRGVLKAWRPSQGGSGGHGDGFATTVLRSVGRDSYADRVMSDVAGEVEQAGRLIQSALRWNHLPRLDGIAAGIPQLDPATARDVASYLATADRTARRALRIGPDHWPLPGNPPCDACGLQLLRAQTSAQPTAAWTVVCTNERCRCRGRVCACGMPVREQGVRHIWGAGSELVARAISGVFATNEIEGVAA